MASKVAMALTSVGETAAPGGPARGRTRVGGGVAAGARPAAHEIIAALMTLRRRLALAGAAALSLAAASAPARGLPPDVELALQRARIGSEALAVVVEAVDSGEHLVSLNAREPFNPASLFKLVTTAAALDQLGPNWQWTTPVWLAGPVRDGVLEGDLVLQGRGDPSLVMERVWLLLRRVQQAGVRHVRGDIVLDRSAFAPGPQDPAAFDGEPTRPYNVPADALLFNHRALTLGFTPDATSGVARVSVEPALAGVQVDRAVPLSPGACNDWRRGLQAELGDAQRIRLAGTYPTACGERAWPLAYADPARFEARLIEGLWREMGGTLGGQVRDGPAPLAAPPAFEFASPPLAQVVRDINKFSNNVMAQQLFLTLGWVRFGPGSGPREAREVLRQWLVQQFGADAASAVVDNGSGLSREVRLSARLLARLLQRLWSSPHMPELLASLPATGQDGTLRRWSAPAGRAHLKTGSLRDVAGVAGVVLGSSGRRYVLVAMVNHPAAGSTHARAALDALARWVSQDLSER
jgi:D-alanyl-D-alanine carboxypeptidase/D-alanyl-D-alanine-endopeptidase (penicillin-binding protein 4)